MSIACVERNKFLVRNLLLTDARNDVNTFARLCVTDPEGRPLRQGALHHELQRFLDRERRALVELPRDHGKSVQVCLRVLWELGHDPSLRVKIICSSDELADERCRFLRDHIRSNRALRQVFPRLRPGGSWARHRFTIERPGHVIGPSVTAVGLGAASTGSRADLLICDDIVDVRSLTSWVDRVRVKRLFFDNLMNQLEPTGRLWCLFTPWHRDDLNAALKRNPAYALFRRAIGGECASIWPEKWPREALLARQSEIGSLSFARGYRLECLAEEDALIKPAWIQFWMENQPQMNTDKHRLGGGGAFPSDLSDPCSSVFIGGSSPYERIVLAIDPAVSTRASADRTALVVLGETPGHEIHVLEAAARRIAAPDLVALIDDFDRRWRPDVIVFESNAAFAGVRDVLLRHARFGPKIKSVTQTHDKRSRVHAFSVTVENGAFRLEGRAGAVAPGQQELWEEMTSFPICEHDDLLDAAMMGTAWLLERPEPRVW